MCLDVAVDELAGLRAHGDGAGAEDHAVGDDGLGVDARERLGRLVGKSSDLGGHFGGRILVELGFRFFGEDGDENACNWRQLSKDSEEN